MARIEEFGRNIGEEFHPQRVVLFGSYAYGKPTADSDVDILVIMDHDGRSSEQAVRIRRKLSPPFPLDLLVRSPEAVKARLEMGDYFMEDILKDGRVLYEAHNG